MSNATDTVGCISHRPNSKYFIMYEDFQDIAKKASPEHEHKLAAFWRVLETKTNDRLGSIPEVVEECKKKGIPVPEEYLWIAIPYSEFVNRSRGIYKASAFQIAAPESERLGFSKSRTLKRKSNPDDPDSPLEDYKEYLFLTDVMQTALTSGEMPTPIEINSPLLISYNKRKEEKKRKRAIEKNSPPVLKKIAPPIEINNKNNSNVSLKDEEECVCSDDTSLPETEPQPNDTHTSFSQGEHNGHSTADHPSSPSDHHGRNDRSTITAPGSSCDRQASQQVAPSQNHGATPPVVGSASLHVSPPVVPSLSTDVQGEALSLPNHIASPPADDKSQVNKQDLIARRRWAELYLNKDGITKEDLRKAFSLRKEWIRAYGAYGDKEWDDKAFIWIAQQENSTFESIKRIYQSIRKDKPKTGIHPETIQINWYRLGNGQGESPPSPTAHYTDYTYAEPVAFKPMKRRQEARP